MLEGEREEKCGERGNRKEGKGRRKRAWKKTRKRNYVEEKARENLWRKTRKGKSGGRK